MAAVGGQRETLSSSVGPILDSSTCTDFVGRVGLGGAGAHHESGPRVVVDLEPELDWQFATTYAQSAPHEYICGKTPDPRPRTSSVPHCDPDVRCADEVLQHDPDLPDNADGVEALGHARRPHTGFDLTLINRGRLSTFTASRTLPVQRLGSSRRTTVWRATWDAQQGMTDEEKAQASDSFARSSVRSWGERSTRMRNRLAARPGYR